MTDKSTATKLQESVKSLRKMIDIQCSDGNWNYDPYMHGMANGMIFALSLFEDGEPKYLAAPDQWIKDRPAEAGPPIRKLETEREQMKISYTNFRKDR